MSEITKHPWPVTTKRGNVTRFSCLFRVPGIYGELEKIHVIWLKNGDRLNGTSHPSTDTRHQSGNSVGFNSKNAKWKFGTSQGGTRLIPGRFVSVVTVSSESGDTYEGILVIQNTTLRDNGLYSCSVDTPHGPVTSSQARLTVQESVQVTHISAAQSKKSGDFLYLDCTVKGLPLPDVHWDFQSSSAWLQHLKLTDLMQISNTKVSDLNNTIHDQLGQATISVYFPRVDSRHDGKFLCKAGDVSMVTTVTVEEEPQIQNRVFPTWHKVVEGETAVLVCNASGTLPLKFEWHHPDYRDALKDNDLLQIISAGSQSMMVIVQAFIKQSATYSCTVSNKYGQATHKQTLEIDTAARFCSRGSQATTREARKPVILPSQPATLPSRPCRGNTATGSTAGSSPSADDSFRLAFFITISLLVIIMLVIIIIGMNRVSSTCKPFQPPKDKQTS